MELMSKAKMVALSAGIRIPADKEFGSGEVWPSVLRGSGYDILDATCGRRYGSFDDHPYTVFVGEVDDCGMMVNVGHIKASTAKRLLDIPRCFLADHPLKGTARIRGGCFQVTL